MESIVMTRSSCRATLSLLIAAAIWLITPATALSQRPLPLDVDGHIIMPEPKAQFSLGDFAGVWEEGGRVSTSYVDRSTGAPAGTDSLTFTIKMTINKDGSYSSEFFEIRNGRTNRDITTGTIAIEGRLLSVT